MKKSLFEYDDQNDYTVDVNTRPSDSSSVSKVSHEVVYNGVNVVVDALPQNVEIGDQLIYDTQTLSLKILKMATYNAATFDALTTQNPNGRYIMSKALWTREMIGYEHFTSGEQASSKRWAERNEYKLSGFDLTQAGSFTFISTGYQAASSATTISWEAGATLDSIVAQFTTGNGGVIGNASYNAKKKDGDDIIFYVGGTGTNLITIGSATGGAANVELTDYSMYVKIGSHELTDEAELVHRSFEGSTFTSLFASYFPELTFPVKIDCYTKTGANRSWYAFISKQIAKTYHKTTNGSTTFVSDLTSNTSTPMNEATFLACRTSESAKARECYERNGGSWDRYIGNMCADLDTMKGTVGSSYGDHGERSRARASVFYKNHNDQWVPCYPADYAASQMGVTVEGYTTGFEPGNFYLSGSFDVASFIEDETRTKFNKYFSALGCTTLGSSGLWAGDEYDGYCAWIFHATNGRLNIGYKMSTFGVRGSLALKF